MQTVAQVAHRAREDVNTKFLASLGDSGNMTASCMVAGVSRTEMYRRREKDPELRAAWDAAIEISVDKLELVARNRAIKGVKEPVYYKGAVVGAIHKPSDRLMELLLKAHRPDKFNPVQKLEHSGGVSVSVVQFGGEQGAQPRTIEHQIVSDPGIDSREPSSSEIEHQAPGSPLPEDERGGHFAGGTPKPAVAQNDEPPHVVKFADSEPE